MTVPAAVKRTSGAAANFLWDNSSYILGVSLKKGEDDAEREKRRNKDIKCFEACRELHHSMLDGMEYPAAKAVLNFLDKWEPQKAEENNLVAQYAKEILSGANMVFRFNGGYVHDDPQLASVWQKANAKQKDNIGQCLVTGALDEIQKHTLRSRVCRARSRAVRHSCHSMHRHSVLITRNRTKMRRSENMQPLHIRLR